MVNVDTWMGAFSHKLKEAFGLRLLFLGIRGSYGRGEERDILAWVPAPEGDEKEAFARSISWPGSLLGEKFL